MSALPPSSPASQPDWTLEKYASLLRALAAAGYDSCRIDRYLGSAPQTCVLLRHDVDRRPANAIAMARLEKELGVSATYYVRTVRTAYSDELVEEIAALGHEVGYHYEVLAKCRGDVEAALELFREELTNLRRLAPILTASAHGSPLSPWDSLDIWRHATPADFGLLGEAYLELDYERIGYYTDTGRSWSADATNLRDRVDADAERWPVVRTTDELIRVLDRRPGSVLCVQTHPERWNADPAGRARSAMFDLAANSAKRIIRTLRAGHAR